MTPIDPKDLLNMAKDAYLQRQREENRRAVENTQKEKEARQAYAESVLRPLLDVNLTDAELTAYGIAIGYTVNTRQQSRTIDETTEPELTFTIADTGIHGTIKFTPAAAAHWSNNGKPKAARWTVTSSKKGYSDTTWWAEGEDNLRIALVHSVGRMAAAVEDAEREQVARQKQREADDARYQQSLREREAREKATRIKLYQDAATEDAEIRPIVEATRAQVREITQRPIEPLTVYSVTWQTGWVPFNDDEEGRAITESGWTQEDDVVDNGFVRMYQTHKGWRLIRVPWMTSVWERFEFSTLESIPYEFKQPYGFEVKGVRTRRLDNDMRDVTASTQPSHRFFVYDPDSSYADTVGYWLAPWVAETLGYPPAPNHVEKDIRAEADQKQGILNVEEGEYFW